ncbi:hypothetical protein [Streptomyces gulbargensis]|uniref:hypothetical protein n=1 Tax=Streptomyces gulbargensis TaxID=364901 RepID=UPI0031EABE32
MTCRHCPSHDFTATPAQRGEAIQLAGHAAPFADALDDDAVQGVLLASGADPESVDAALSTASYGAQAAAHPVSVKPVRPEDVRSPSCARAAR